MHFQKLVLASVMMAAGSLAMADDAADVEAAIKKWQDLWNAGDATAAAAQVFTEDARLLPPDGPMVEGREAIAAFWQPVLDSPAKDIELTLIAVDIQGDTAIETGTWAVTVPADGGGEMQVGGKTLVVWKKGDDGQWRMAQDMWNNGN